MADTVCEEVIRSLGQLIQAVTPPRPDPVSGRLRSYAIYRGVRRIDWRLLSSLDTLGMPASPPHAKAHLEEHLLRNFIRYARPHLPIRPTNDWEFLFLAEHYGLPTRLLDWSTSPLVAAHFATTRGEEGEDRVIWRLDWKQVHLHFGLPDRALTVDDLGWVLGRKGVDSPWDLFKGTRPGEVFVCMLEPPALDARIVAQSAAFTLSSDTTRPLDVILAESGLLRSLTRYVVPAASVQRMRDQLDLSGIDERRLFPDLGGIAAEVRRYYSSSATEADERENAQE